jgi:hypothetical protein
MRYTENIQAMLDDLFFRAALYLASPVLYESLARSAFCAGKLTESEKLSVSKYFNRFCFRPTPFGLFASVSLAQWGEEMLFPDGPLNVYIEPDQAYSQGLGEAMLRNGLSGECLYEPNPTLYKVMDAYRFVRTDVTSGSRAYLLQSIGYSKILKELLDFCRQGRPVREISSHIAQLAEIKLTEAHDYFAFLADAQFLVGRLRPNITGENYLERLLEEGGSSHESAAQLRAFLLELKLQGAFIPGQLQRMIAAGNRLSPGCRLSVTLLRSGAAMADMRCQELIRDGIFALDALCPKDHVPSLEQFVRDFQRSFDGQMLPLLTVMDPECGIGYLPGPAGQQDE